MYHTRGFIEQCRDDVIDASACIEHDVTTDYSGGLTVSRLNGTSLSLVVYQDRDEVVRLRLAQDEKSKNSSGQQGKILPISFRMFIRLVDLNLMLAA